MTKNGSALVSVVIANKDGERFLKRCLEAVLAEKGSMKWL